VHLTRDVLEHGLDHVRASPHEAGTLELIVRRPSNGTREAVAEAILDLSVGLVGDNWLVRGSRSTPDRAAHPDKQLTLMNDRAALLVAAGDADRRKLAGDQLYVDLDLSPANLPAGTRLAVGDAVIEVTAPPHLGCQKFAARFGQEAWRFVNSRPGRELRLRGINARIVVAGTVRRGDFIRKLDL
jgi:MOSC domain-containing protein YiiM